MQVRFNLPDDNDEVTESRKEYIHDWQYLSPSRVLAILFVCLTSVSILAGMSGESFQNSFALGFLVCIAVAGIIFYPSSAI